MLEKLHTIYNRLWQTKNKINGRDFDKKYKIKCQRLWQTKQNKMSETLTKYNKQNKIKCQRLWQTK